jgi:Resolvase, N terminal domain
MLRGVRDARGPVRLPCRSVSRLGGVGHGGGFVAYYRVSTAEQGRSGLGIEAQVAAVKSYLNGGDWHLVGEFTETESGKRRDRPELDKALVQLSGSYDSA